MLTINVDDQVKKEFTEIVADLGLNPTAAINLFVRAVIREKSIPFSVTLRTREEQEWNDYVSARLKLGYEDMLEGRVMPLEDATSRIAEHRSAQ